MLVHVLMQTYHTMLFRDIRMVIIVAWIFLCVRNSRDCTCSRARTTRCRSQDIENTGYYQVEICFSRIRRRECTCSRVHILRVACHGILKIVNFENSKYYQVEIYLGRIQRRECTCSRVHILRVVGHGTLKIVNINTQRFASAEFNSGMRVLV